MLRYEGLIDKIYIMNRIHKYKENDWQKNRVYFLLATKIESALRYCFWSISLFSNRVPSVFRWTSRAKTALVFFFWSPLLNFDISWRKITSSFLRVSTKLQKFGWDYKVLLLNQLFHPNKNKARNNNIIKDTDRSYLLHCYWCRYQVQQHSKD